jgi:predicted nucleic acid-binding protein
MLDTNVLVYALDKGSPHHKKAAAFLQKTTFNFFITTKDISEYFAVCSKLGIALPKTLTLYGSVCRNAQTLFPDSGSLAIFEKLLQKYQPKGNRFFDLEMYRSPWQTKSPKSQR